MKGEILKAAEMKKMLEKLAGRVGDETGKNFVIIGIQRRGAILAERLRKIFASRGLKDIPAGFLDISLYRDDFSRISHNPVVSGSEILFDIEGKTVLLVDDVLYTGRTIRAALDQIMDYGRPRAIKLLVLVDRGGRELPVQPDFTGLKTVVGKNQLVDVRLKEIDKKDTVVIAGKA